MTHVICNSAKDTVREADCSSDSSLEVEILPHTEFLVELVPKTDENNSPKATVTSSPADSTPQYSLSSSDGDDKCEDDINLRFHVEQHEGTVHGCSSASSDTFGVDAGTGSSPVLESEEEEEPKDFYVHHKSEDDLQDSSCEAQFGESTRSILLDGNNPVDIITTPHEKYEQQYEYSQRNGIKRKANQLEDSSNEFDDTQKKPKQHPTEECYPDCQCCSPVATNSTMSSITAGCSSDSSVNCMLQKNELLCSTTNRYQVLDFVGQGAFGQVVICWVEGTRKLVALKMLKKSLTDYKSQREAEILQKLSEENVDEFHVVRLYESFTYKNHLCLVFECLEQSLQGFIRKMNFCAIPMSGMRIILKQLLTTLVKLKELKIIHTDIKPDNIMLVDPEKNPFGVKVIDFGNALIGSAGYHCAYIQTRCYRAPEVLLGLPFTEKVDMWSLGCVAGELFLRETLYPGGNEYDQIRYITEAQGVPTNYMLHAGTKTNKFFCCETKGVLQTWRLKTPEEYENETGISSEECRRYKFTTLDEMAVVHLPEHLKGKDYRDEMNSRGRFISLLKKMLALDPRLRISPEEALRHDFLNTEN